MTDKERALMCAEVDEFLDYLGEAYISKIPENILRDIRIFKQKNYQKKIKGHIKDYNDLGFSYYTLVFISYLNVEYWVEDEAKKKSYGMLIMLIQLSSNKSLKML
ncbi:MAG: hypothetical protein LUF02_08505 [Erysipelotrichaceae bacterium]|nr:hypothetical protein [Erysipelotrichaceae bacterium]